MKQLFLKYTIALAIVYTSVTSCSTSAFFYNPTKKLSYYPDTSIYNVEEINFKASDGNNLNGWFLKSKISKPIIATVLQLHGNGGNISYQYHFAERFA